MFVEIEDLTSTTELIVFPRTFKETAELWMEGRVVAIKGKVTNKNNEHKIIVDRVHILDLNDPSQINKVIKNLGGHTAALAAASQPQKAVIYINSMSETQKIGQLKSLFEQYPGQHSVILECGTNGSTKRIITRFKISLDDTLKSNIEAITGKNTVKTVE